MTTLTAAATVSKVEEQGKLGEGGVREQGIGVQGD